MNSTFSQQEKYYYQIEKALRYIGNTYLEQPSLGEIAKQAHLSEFNFQKIFTRWAGISPKKFLQFLTKEHAKSLLDQSKNLLEVTYDSGLSSPSRLHDLFVTTEALTPGEYKLRGEGLEISYGFHATPFGQSLIGVTDKGICYLAFDDGSGLSGLLSDMQTRFPKARLTKDIKKTEPHVKRIFTGRGKSHMHLLGSSFQIKVWEALMKVPAGQLTTYQSIAKSIGRPTASRAVGGAVGGNPIAYLIPCHRVIRSVGEFGNYRWGAERKKIILGWEFSVDQRLSNYSIVAQNAF